MARAGATDEEIKLLLKLNPRQTQTLKPKTETERARRRVRLRRKQTELAMAGNEQMLRLLGEIELEQTKSAVAFASQNRNLPNFDTYPDTGYPDDDPRSIAIQNARALTAQSLLFFARFIATATQETPTLTLHDLLTTLAEALNLPHPPLPPSLAKKIITSPP